MSAQHAGFNNTFACHLAHDTHMANGLSDVSLLWPWIMYSCPIDQTPATVSIVYNSNTSGWDCDDNVIMAWHVMNTGSCYNVTCAWYTGRADSKFAPSQWETALLCNDVSHWLGASLESRFTPSQWEMALLCNDVSHWLGASLDTNQYSHMWHNNLYICIWQNKNESIAWSQGLIC